MLSVCSGGFTLVCSLYTGTIVSTEQRLMLFNSTQLETLKCVYLVACTGIRKMGAFAAVERILIATATYRPPLKWALSHLPRSKSVHVLHTSSLFSSFL